VSPWVKNVLLHGVVDVEGIIGQLDGAYDTKEDINDGEQQMLVLGQKGRSFAVYYADFERSLIAADGVTWPDRVKRLFLESGFSRELRAALIPVKKPEKFEDYINVVRRVALDLERSKGQATGYGFSSSGSKSTTTGSMDWEAAPEVRLATLGVESSSVRAKRVSRDVLDARKAQGLCLRCGNRGHRVADCEYLPPVAVNTVGLGPRTGNGTGSQKNSVRISKSSADRIREINQVLEDLEDDDDDY
jgi:hypothetical protein